MNVIEPVQILEISSDPLHALVIKEDGIFVCDAGGIITMWT